MTRTGWLPGLAIVLGVAIVSTTALSSFMKHAIYPIPPVEVGAPPAGFEDAFWTLEDGVVLHGWHGGAAGDERPVILFFHGNGENLATLEWSGIFDRWRELGLYVVAMDYPGYGRSGGSPDEKSVVAGGLAALDWTRRELPDRPLIVAGWSLGAAAAIQVTALRPGEIDGLLLMSPWSRLLDVASTMVPEFLAKLLVSDRYDSIAAAAKVGCPSLVLHGESDSIIPAELGRRLAEALAPRSRWAMVAGAGHNDLLARPEAWDEVRAFLDRLDLN